MSEGMNELEAALRQFQPSPMNSGRLLVEMGRASATGSARIWQAVSAFASTVAVVFAVLLFLQPEPATRVEVVHVPAAVPSVAEPEAPSEWIETDEVPLSVWMYRQQQQRFAQPAGVADVGDEPARPSQPMRAGDLMVRPGRWTEFTSTGVWQ